MSEEAATYTVNPEVNPEVYPEELEELLTYDEKMMDLFLTLDQLDEDISSLRELIVQLEELKQTVAKEIDELRNS